MRVLLLGGTGEASALARALAQAQALVGPGSGPGSGAQIEVMLSYAGRTASPAAQPVPVRIGGFGGAQGLARYMREHGITHLIDATHPFAARMSANAVAGARLAGVPMVALTRPPWVPVEGDRWTHVESVEAAVAALPETPSRVMLAMGRMHVEAFAARPQHRYLLRFVDAPEVPPALPLHDLVVDRGPFTAGGDLRLMRGHGIEVVVSKNAGGSGAGAKLAAARELGLPVIMIARPPVPERNELHAVAEVMEWLGHAALSGAERGV